MAGEWVDSFIDAVEKLAFDMPAPNQYTPQFVQLCLAAKQLRSEEKHREEHKRWQEHRRTYTRADYDAAPEDGTRYR